MSVSDTTRPRAETNTGKVCIITGGNSGIGLNASISLARDGFEIILACRNSERGKTAAEIIKRDVKDAKVTVIELDLSSLKSVRKFVDNFHKTGKPLHVLCNNAGLQTTFRGTNISKTEDGFETTFGVNHLGHFLLTLLLLNDLRRTANLTGEARIVVTSSSLHDQAQHIAMGLKGPFPCIDFENLMLEKQDTFLGRLAYSNSKLANILFTYELARRLEGSDITVNCFCPGFIPQTGLMRNESWFTRFLYRGPLGIYLRSKGIVSTVEEGGMNLFHLAADASVKGVAGKYFQFLVESESSKESYDKEVAARLWNISAEMVDFEAAKNV